MSLFKKFTANSDSDDGYKLSDDEIVEEKQESKQEDPIDFPELVNDDDGEEEGESNAMEKESGQTKRIRSPEALAKKKEKFAEMKRRRKERNEQNRITFDAEHMSPMEQAAYFWSYVVVENTDNRYEEYGMEYPFTEEYLQTYSLPHADDLLTRRMKEVNPEWKRQYVQKRKDAKNGSPSVLIVCMSAIRCTELLKSLSSFNIYIPKLFSKHIKIDEQKKALQRYTPIAIGVPNRMFKLAEEGILDLSSVSTIIIDTKENDTKLNVLGQKYTREDFVKMYMKYLHNGVIHKNTKVVLW